MSPYLRGALMVKNFVKLQLEQSIFYLLSLSETKQQASPLVDSSGYFHAGGEDDHLAT